MKVYKTKKDIADKKSVSVNSVNNREQLGKVVKMYIDNKKDPQKPKKVGYVS